MRFVLALSAGCLALTGLIPAHAEDPGSAPQVPSSTAQAAGNVPAGAAPTGGMAALPPPTSAVKWRNFLDETFDPLVLAAGAFNGSVSHAGQSDPKYGPGTGPLGERFGASVADIASQNFFGDFVLATALHEDPRYRRRGKPYGMWARMGYAASRAVVIRSDGGKDVFNWSNVLGAAMSAGLSNAYYPPASRNASASAVHFGMAAAGAGLGNIPIEFWPEVRGWLKRHFF